MPTPPQGFERRPARLRGAGFEITTSERHGWRRGVWHELKEEGRTVHHPVFPGKEGPAARRIEDEADVRDVIELMRLDYDRIVARYRLPDAA